MTDLPGLLYVLLQVTILAVWLLVMSVAIVYLMHRFLP